MKKVLTVIAIAALVACAVFAADGAKETHQIKLKTQVGAVVPVFQLVYTSGTNVKDSQSARTNEAQVKYDASTAHSYDETIDEVEVNDISKNDISVVFTAVLNNKTGEEAKQNASYDLTFSAGPFNVKKNKTDGTVPVASTAVAAAETIGNRLGVTAGDVSDVDKAKAADGTTDVVVSRKIPMNFNGTTCANGELATFAVTYTHDTSVDPNTNNSYYYADIKLEIVSK